MKGIQMRVHEKGRQGCAHAIERKKSGHPAVRTNASPGDEEHALEEG